MSNATFHNFTDVSFTGYWNGKPKTFKPGEQVVMPAWLAEHFAKHLTNKVLIENGKEAYTSPKKPLDVPEFMNVFNKAFLLHKPIPGGNEVDEIIASAAIDEPSMNIDVVQPKPSRDGSAAAAAAEMQGEEDPYEPTGSEVGPGSGATIIGEAGDDEDEYEGEDESNSAESA